LFALVIIGFGNSFSLPDRWSKEFSSHATDNDPTDHDEDGYNIGSG